MCYVVRWANRTSSMCAFETAPVICGSIYCYLFNWIHGLLTSQTLFSGTGKHICNFVLTVNRLLWFYYFWGSLEAFVETTSSFEGLIEVRPAVKHSFKGIEVSKLKGAFAVVASKASLVINTVISGKLINQIHSFVAGCTFLGCSCKCHCSTMKHPERIKVIQT